jgi:hypothetical protein
MSIVLHLAPWFLLHLMSKIRGRFRQVGIQRGPTHNISVTEEILAHGSRSVWSAKQGAVTFLRG